MECETGKQVQREENERCKLISNVKLDSWEFKKGKHASATLQAMLSTSGWERNKQLHSAMLFLKSLGSFQAAFPWLFFPSELHSALSCITWPPFPSKLHHLASLPL
ncbi:hypothetical protein DUNSADRAFT_10475 [Dunaliella salina]|uniref:Uncharacterized protein n=1 Tax=Dunaliella salina TaxID=3046 RepID=A0ABQ7GF95_DUNSA|nr:hypothetical protein DUNSADRAFT_10475 [Dunaliella salina]|eukprot:KAF5833276.1 hypothetical protein DUNSADRAFT_10475 [Dunaliella salina]